MVKDEFVTKQKNFAYRASHESDGNEDCYY
jgi:hypothetical protein